MNIKQKKENTVNEIKDLFSKSECVFVVNNLMDCSSSQKLKKDIKSVGGDFRVFKNTLLRIAAKENENIGKLEPYFKNQITVIFSKENSQDVASLVFKRGYTQELINFNAGIINSEVFGKDKFELMSKIPSKEILYSQLCGVILAPISKLAFVLSEVSKKSKEESN